MKKLLVLVVLVGILVFSCNLFQESTVINKSNQLVSFQLSKNDSKIISLTPDESVSIDGGFGKVYNLKPEKRLSQKWSEGNIITITDIQPYEVYAENTLDVPVTLSADGWMDDMVNINKGSAHDKGLIYTKNPKFNASSSSDSYLFPIKTEYNFVNSIFYVKIF